MACRGSNARRITALITAVLSAAVVLAGCSSEATTSWENGPAVTVPSSSELVPVSVGEIDTPVAVDGALVAGAMRTQWTWSDTSVSQQWSTAQSDPEPDRGYVVDATSQIAVAPAARLPVLTEQNVAVSGHPAVLSTAAAVPDASGLINSNRWVSWRLADGRYVHVWGGADARSLLTFAGTFVERTTVISRSVLLAVAFPGMTQLSGGRDRRSTALIPGWTRACPAQAAIRSWFGGAAADDSDQCIGASVLQGSSAQQGAGPMNGPGVTVNGLQVFTSPNHDQAAAQSGDAWVYVQVPYKQRADGTEAGNLTPAELATLVASVRFDPGIVLAD